MPARREKIVICAAESGQPTWIQEFPLWWERRAFFDKFRERMIDTGNPYYVDYGLLLTAGEAIAWDRQCRQAISEDPVSQKAHLVEAMALLESRLGKASWVIVESAEWESGLD